MNTTKRKTLQDAGFRIGDAADFLGLTDEERQIVELRVSISRAVRRRREDVGLSQTDLAHRMRPSQSRIAKVEAGSDGMSLDLMFRSLFAVGGSLGDVLPSSPNRKRPTRKRPTRKPPDRKQAAATKPVADRRLPVGS